MGIFYSSKFQLAYSIPIVEAIKLYEFHIESILA